MSNAAMGVMFLGLMFTAVGYVGFGPLANTDTTTSESARRTRRLFRILGPIVLLIAVLMAVAA